MSKWLKILLIVVGVIAVLVIALFFAMRSFGMDLVHPSGEVPTDTPADWGLPYEDVVVTTDDGLNLVGWYIPSENGAVVIVQHGFQTHRGRQLYEAELLHRNGYGVLLSTARAHDLSDGELIRFGLEEMKDFDAWYQYLLSRDDIDHERIGAYGSSYGAMLLMQYAAQNPDIKVVASHSSFASLKDTVEKYVEKKTGMSWPLAPMIVFWAEREADLRAEDIDATKYIGQISPRPVFIMMGCQDDYVSLSSGDDLYAAAGEPKPYWLSPEGGHSDLNEVDPETFDACVVTFFDQYLLGDSETTMEDCLPPLAECPAE